MININPYCAVQFEKQFKNSYIARSLKSRSYTKLVYDDVFKQRHTETITSRHHAFRRIMYMATFYYLQFLQEHNPEYLYDLGCGANIFKQFYPNLVGISGPNIRGEDETIYGDEQGTVNDAYILENANRFEAAFSINALHFTNFRNLRKVMQDFITLIKPGGRGYLALNIARLDDYSGSEEMLELFGVTDSSNYVYTIEERKTIDDYIRNVVSELSLINVLVFEIVATPDEYVDGNIRLVFEKNK